MERDAEIRTAVGAVVRRERKALGLTLKGLAELAEVDWSLLARLERGESWVSSDRLERVASELGFSLPDLYARALPRRGRRAAPRRLSAREVRRQPEQN